MSYRILALSGILACLVAPRVDATIIRHLDFSALVAKAHAIAYGRVIDLRARQSDDRMKIETVVTLEVASYLKGDLGEELTFVVPGGMVGRYRAVVVGAPEFREGEEVVLFLTARGPAMPRVVGLNQGVFRVGVDSRTGARTIARVPTFGAVIRGSASNQPLSLSAFSGLVRSMVEQAR